MFVRQQLVDNKWCRLDDSTYLEGQKVDNETNTIVRFVPIELAEEMEEYHEVA